MNLPKYFLNLLLGLCALGQSMAQTFIVAGIIKNEENGESLPYATVKIKETGKGAVTNVEGYFTLLNLPGDSITIEASYIGFYSREFRILPLNQNFLAITLAPSTAQLEELVVTAESYQIMNASEGISFVKLSPKDLSLLPGIGEEDIFRSLQLMPGVGATNENSSGLYVRGGTPDQTLVTYDGMTVYHVDHFFGFFSAFNPDAIKDVQFYRGAFPAKYGGRTSGVVDLTGRTGSVDKIELDAGINLLSSRLTVSLPLFGKASILLSGRRSYSDFLESGLYKNIYGLIDSGGQDQDAALDNLDPDFTPTSHFYDLNGKVTYRPGINDNFTLTLYNGEDHLDKSRDINNVITIPNLSIRRLLEIDTEDLTDWGNNGVSLRWARQWHPKFFSNALVTYSTYFSDFNFDFTFRLSDFDTDTTLILAGFKAFEKNKVKDFTYGLENEFHLSENHKLDFGFQAKNYNLTYQFVRDDTITIYDSRQKSDEIGMFLQETWKIGKSIQINGGIRGIYYDLLEEYFLEPRISFEFSFLKNWKIKGGWGIFHQFVNRVINENVTTGSRDFFLLSDNQALDVHRSEQFITGGSFEKENWLLDIELYQKEMTGLSEFSLRFQRQNEIDPTQLFFKGKGKARGGEFLLQKKSGNYRGWASYSISRIEHTFPDLNAGNSFPALHDQSHEFKMAHIYSTGDLNLGLTFIYGSGKPYTQPESLYEISLLDGRDLNYIHVGTKNANRLPAYHRLDVSAHYTLKINKSNLVLGVSIFNLYNHKNVWYKQFDATDLPILITDVNYLGFTPNFSISFKL